MQYAYAYDGAGNLQSVTRGEATNTYTYGNADWKDLLTAFNGEKIVYEGQTWDEDGSVTGAPVSGNPIRYYNGTPWNFSWAEGRNLKSASASTPEQDIALDFAYDADGLRIEKHVTKTLYELTDHTHEFMVLIARPTCTEKGYTLHKCACGYSYCDNYTDALGHFFGRPEPDGSYVCIRCGYKERPAVRPTVINPSSALLSLEEPTEPEVPMQEEPVAPHGGKANHAADYPAGPLGHGASPSPPRGENWDRHRNASISLRRRETPAGNDLRRDGSQDAGLHLRQRRDAVQPDLQQRHNGSNVLLHYQFAGRCNVLSRFRWRSGRSLRL